ncbi:MAG: glycoside hydrolase family 27 protein, partial [Clostridia bacterium]|nr:glycoside hydrolase family 27 protein [Clostridia bacterium]
GRLLPAKERFPSGFRAVADEIHSMGLKFGIHIMRGIPRQAAHERLPVYGLEGVTCDKIADPFSICRWNSDMYGVRNTPEGQAYYDSLFELYASWGVDYVKVDDICNLKAAPDAPYSAKHEVEMIARSIEKCGRKMVLSLSPGPALIEEAWHMSEYANMWRITDDFWDRWDLLKDMFRRCELWQEHVKPGCWPDCDMLPLGRIGIGFRNPRITRFTKEEQITLMTLWCVFRSPLMMGGEMRDNDAFTLQLLTNRDVLFLIGHGKDARQLFRNEEEAAWYCKDDNGREYLALFNLSDDERKVSAPVKVFTGTAKDVKELWGRQERLLSPVSAKLPAHGCVIVRV